jgi:hypothetical protein
MRAWQQDELSHAIHKSCNQFLTQLNLRSGKIGPFSKLDLERIKNQVEVG